MMWGQSRSFPGRLRSLHSMCTTTLYHKACEYFRNILKLENYKIQVLLQPILHELTITFMNQLVFIPEMVRFIQFVTLSLSKHTREV